MTNLNNLIEFIETHQLTSKLMFTLVSEKDSTGLQISWSPLEQYSKWSYRELFSSEWIDISSSQLESLICCYQIDPNTFSNDFKHSLLENISEHYLILAERYNILRKDLIKN